MWLLLVAACTSPIVDTGEHTGEVTLPETCPEWSAPALAGPVSNPELTEISGLVASRRHAEVLWAHEDSGAGPDITALSTTGEVLATLTLSDVTPFDWEDIAAATIDGAPHLVVADIGDNAAIRANLSLYVVPEPSAVSTATVSAERLVLTYEDGARDAEALWVDDGTVWILTKRDSPARLYSAPLEDGAVLTLEGTVQFGEAPLLGGTPTAADLNADGTLLTLRSYTHAWAFRRPRGTPWIDILTGEPCEVAVAEESQGEAITVDASGAVYTVSENEPLLYRSERSVE